MGACIARLLSSRDGDDPALSSTRRTKFLQLGGAHAFADPLKMLEHTDPVTAEDGASLYTMARAMISNVSEGQKEAKIFLTFAAGSRECDAPDVGPGTYHAAAITRKLWDEGVLCFSPLMLPADGSRAAFRHPWATGKHQCETLLVLLTAALYNDMECLRDIYHAQVNKIKLLPLRLESDLPDQGDAWPAVTKEDLDGMLMVSDLSWGFFQLNSIPSPPHTLIEYTSVLDEIVTDLKLQVYRKSNKQKSDEKSSASNVASLLGSPHQCKGATSAQQSQLPRCQSDVRLLDTEETAGEEQEKPSITSGQSDSKDDLPRRLRSDDRLDESKKREKDKDKEKSRRKRAEGRAKQGDLAEGREAVGAARLKHAHTAEPVALGGKPELLSPRSHERDRANSANHHRTRPRPEGIDTDEQKTSPRLRPPDREKKLPRQRGSPQDRERKRQDPEGVSPPSNRAKEMAAALRKAARDKDDKKPLRA